MNELIWLIPAGVLTVGLVLLVVKAKRKQSENNTHL